MKDNPIMSQRAQLFLIGVVAVAWLAVVLVPMVTTVEISAQIQIGVQGAMMLILGAVFGVRLVRRNGGGSS